MVIPVKHRATLVHTWGVVVMCDRSDESRAIAYIVQARRGRSALALLTATNKLPQTRTCQAIAL